MLPKHKAGTIGWYRYGVPKFLHLFEIAYFILLYPLLVKYWIIVLSQVHYYDSSLDAVNNFELFYELIILFLFPLIFLLFQFFKYQLISRSVVSGNSVFGKLFMEKESNFLLELLAKVVFYWGIEVLTWLLFNLEGDLSIMELR